MKQYTFFISGKAENKKNELYASTVIVVTQSSDLLLSKATLEAREQFKKDVEDKYPMNVVLISQINLVGVQDVYKDENGEFKAVS